jgi:hypothetical protein
VEHPVAYARSRARSTGLHRYWWLPDRPDRRIPGRLTWDPDNGGDLELLGELREPRILDNHLPSGDVQQYRAKPEEGDRLYPVIHGGRVTTSEIDEPYTLLRSFSLNSVGFDSLPEHPEHVSAGAVLEGAWYADPADIEADRAIFDIRHLSTWVDTSGLETNYPALEGDTEGPYAIIRGHRLPTFSTTYENAVIKLGQHLEQTGDHERTSGIQQTWQLIIDMSPMGELERFTDIATDVRP